MRPKVVFLCLIAVLLPACRAYAEENLPAAAGFTDYLARDEFRPMYLTELRRLALDEGSLWALRDYAGMLQDGGEIPRAGAFAESLECRRDDLDALARLIRAEGMMRERHSEGALAVLDSLVSAFPIEPAMIESQYLRARCLFELGRYEEARIHLSAVRDRADETLRPSISFYLALAEEELGDIEEALAGYESLHEAGYARGTAGLMRCRLREGDVEGAQDIHREAIVRGINLPHDETEGLLLVTEWGGGELWNDLMGSLAADTTYVPRSALEEGLLRALERGADVLDFYEAFVSREYSPGLAYGRALGAADRRAAYDFLSARVVELQGREHSRDDTLGKYIMATARAASRDDSIELGDRSLLAAATAGYAEQAGDADEVFRWLSLLAEIGHGDIVRPYALDLREGLVLGFDDEALFMLADLLERAGEAPDALEIYGRVADSPLPSGASMASERGAFVAGLRAPEEEDVSSVVEQVATGERSSLDLAEVFDLRLKDYGKAAEYYQRAARETESAAERDRIRLRAAMAFSKDYLTTGNTSSRDKALNFASALASSKHVSPGAVIDLLKSSTDWLTLDLFRSTETARLVAVREDLDDEAMYEISRVLFRLFERGDEQAYDLCLGVLGNLLAREPRSPYSERAALLGAELRLRAGDYAAGLEGFEACLESAKDRTVRNLCIMGMGDCYVGSGGLEEGLSRYEEAGDAPLVRLKRARCLHALGKQDEAFETSGRILKRLMPPEMSVTARILTALSAPHEGGLPQEAFRLYFEHYHELGLYEDLGTYLPLLAAYDLALRGYDGLAMRLLKDLPRTQHRGAHCQVLLSGYDPVTGEHADFFRALARHLAPRCEDALDRYEQARVAALIDCRSGDDEICLRSGRRFRERFPLAREAAQDMEAVRAASLYREMYVGKADAVADTLFIQGVRSDLLAEAVYRKGVSFLLEKANPQAKQTFLMMKEHFPESQLYPDVCFKLGTTCYLVGSYDSSATFFRMAVREGKVALLEDALFNLGLALEETGDLTAASEAFYELARRFPLAARFDRALMRSAYCLEKSGAPLEAGNLYRTLLKYARPHETRAEANFWLGECLSKAGHHVEAALEFMRTGHLYPGQEAWAGTARYRAGMECESAGLMNAARLVYDENVRAFGRESTWGKASHERLSSLGAED